MIEQLLTRGSTSITRGVRQNLEGARKEQQLYVTNNSEETHKRQLCVNDAQFFGCHGGR